MCFARVDLPIPGRPTGIKKIFCMVCIVFYEIKSTTNFNNADSIAASSQLNGTGTSYKIGAFDCTFDEIPLNFYS